MSQVALVDHDTGFQSSATILLDFMTEVFFAFLLSVTTTNSMVVSTYIQW